MITLTTAMIVAYFLLLLLLGLISKHHVSVSVEDYFLAGRKFGKTILFFTLIATNFSAFFFLGFSGAAYTQGLVQYSIMALGTAAMPIMFIFIGFRVSEVGRRHNFMTVPELVGGLSQSKILKMIVLLVLTIYTLPYLVVQAVGAGYILSSMIGLNMLNGAIICLGIITIYVMFGGMRGSGWTDVLQGILMFSAMAAALFFISSSLGGFSSAGQKVLETKPHLLSYPGLDSGLLMIFSFTILWIFVDPMFPQLFTRFYTADSRESLWTSIKLYPIVVAFLFACPVLIGTWANGVDLMVERHDLVLIKMVETYAPSLVYNLVMVGALAALMSTADSQLLVLSTMLSRDLGFKNQIKTSKAITLTLFLFSTLYLVLGFDPQQGIFNTLVSTTFSGLVVLAPTIISLLYFKPKSFSCIASIVAGQSSIVLFNIGIFPSFGLVDGMQALIISAIVLVVFEKIG